MSDPRSPEPSTPDAPPAMPVPDARVPEGYDPEGYDVEEYGSGDDRVIGRALRGSLVVFALLGLLGGGIWLWLDRPQAALPEQAIEVAAPEPVVEDIAVSVPEVVFSDITEAAGIDFVQFNGAYGDKLLPETMGGGLAFLDYDADGDSDLLFTNGAPWPFAAERYPADLGPTPPRLYANDGSGRFEDVTEAAGLGSIQMQGMGVATGDYDGDGRVDVFLTAVGPNRLLRNTGGAFEEVTDAAGLAGDPDAWSTGAAFFDADGDGDLDLFVAQYVTWSRDIDLEVDFTLTGLGRAYGPPQNFAGTDSSLYRNEGNGRFRDISAEAGIQVANPATGQPVGKALGVLPVDADGDGRLDLLVANDTTRNFLFHNLGDGRFEELGERWGLAYDREGRATGAMGVDAAWPRNDADLGLMLGNFAGEMSSLYVRQGELGLYVDEAITEGVGAPSRLPLSFGVSFLDYDLDGRQDLLQANGHLEEQIDAVDPSQSYFQPAQLFWNAGEAGATTYVEVDRTSTGDLARPIAGRGSSYADIDADGDLDLVLTQVAGPPLLLRNDQALGHHWLRLRLVGRAPNTGALGARVTLGAGGQTQRRLLMPSRSYLSAVDLPLSFGLGEAEAVDSLEVIWPDGTSQSVPVPGVDREIVVEQGG